MREPAADQRIVARIAGALGSRIEVGLDGLVISRPAVVAAAARRTAWSYDRVQAVGLGQLGSLTVITLLARDQAEPQPVLVLERDQVGAALDGLVTVRRLIAAAATPSGPSRTDPTLAGGPAGTGLDRRRAS